MLLRQKVLFLFYKQQKNGSKEQCYDSPSAIVDPTN